MDLGFTGKTALITGASKGIGRATAEIMASEGCNVILVSRTASDLAAARASIIKQSTVRVDEFAADLSDSKNVDCLACEFPQIDILVNNAGAIPGGARFSTLMRHTGAQPGISRSSATLICAAPSMR